MKKIPGVVAVAILLTLAFFLVYKHLIHGHWGQERQKAILPDVIEQSVFLGSMLIQ